MVRIFDAAFADNSGTGHEHLGTFWWINSSAQRGQWSRLQAHDFVASQPAGYVYVQVGNYRVTVLAYENNAGTKWIQTVADGTRTDNLLTLAERHKRGLPNY
jgi:hypothetical protein